MTFKPSDAPKVVTSAKAIEKLTKPGRYRDHDVRGLYLQITSLTNRSWVLRYQIAGRPRNLGLGPYPEVGLAKARMAAREARDEIRKGLDPIVQRAERRASLAAQRAKALTFKEAAERFYAAKSGEWQTERQRQTFQSTMSRYVFPIIGGMGVEAVDVQAILRVLHPIWETKPATAGLLRIRLEKILSYAQVSGYRSGDNPARWQSNLSEMLPSHAKIRAVTHHAALDYKALPAFMAKLRTRPGIASGAMQFIILTVPRVQEALGATWEEVDFEADLWTVPAWRMKGRREHVVPLSDAAIAVLKSVYHADANPQIFVSNRAGSKLSDGALRKLLEDLGHKGDATIHGFRSAFRDWCGDHTEFPREVAEAALAHKVGDATEQAYRRGTALEKRRKLMQAWADYCAGEDHKGAVVQFRGRGK